jgi:hypothetical protein
MKFKSHQKKGKWLIPYIYDPEHLILRWEEESHGEKKTFKARIKIEELVETTVW